MDLAGAKGTVKKCSLWCHNFDLLVGYSRDYGWSRWQICLEWSCSRKPHAHVRVTLPWACSWWKPRACSWWQPQACSWWQPRACSWWLPQTWSWWMPWAHPHKINSGRGGLCWRGGRGDWPALYCVPPHPTPSPPLSRASSAVGNFLSLLSIRSKC